MRLRANVWKENIKSCPLSSLMDNKDHHRLVTKVLAKKIFHGNDHSQKSSSELANVRIVFRKDGIAGKGTFGIVQRVKILNISEIDPCANDVKKGEEVFGKEYLAMKTVQLKKKESRELHMLKKISHENIINLRYFYFSHPKSLTEGPIMLNMLFDILPTTFHDEIFRKCAEDEFWTEPEVASYCYQIANGLQYLHDLSIAHRDIKPRNVLLSPSTGLVQICDLGSACHVNSGIPLTAYICSRFYRAPELLLGSKTYGTGVDIWSLGCVIAEMILLRPLLEGEDTGDQLAVIVDLFGAPSDEEVSAMKIEDIVLASAIKVLESGLERSKGPALLELLSGYPDISRIVCQLLVYDPDTRWTAPDILADQYLDSCKYFQGNREGSMK